MVTLLEYGDFECPYCGKAEGVIRELLGSSFGDAGRAVAEADVTTALSSFEEAMAADTTGRAALVRRWYPEV